LGGRTRHNIKGSNCKRIRWRLKGVAKKNPQKPEEDTKKGPERLITGGDQSPFSNNKQEVTSWRNIGHKGGRKTFRGEDGGV